MVITSLKDMDEIRAANILNLPKELSFYSWPKAWSQACTGFVCEGLKPGLINSIKINYSFSKNTFFLLLICNYVCFAQVKIKTGSENISEFISLIKNKHIAKGRMSHVAYDLQLSDAMNDL